MSDAEVFMSLVGLVQLVPGITNQTLENNSPAPQASSKNKVANENASAHQANADSFVPSAQNPANDAGTFQVQQVSLFTPAATILLGQNAAQTPAAAPAASPAADAAATLSDLSNLNASLTVRGLTPSEIAAIDRVAQLVKDFKLTAFSDLINQYQSLAQSAAPQPAAAATTEPSANAATVAAPAVATKSAAA
jgi:hypothetical protein